MSKQQHTPTPWHVDPKRQFRIVAGDDWTVATTLTTDNLRDQWEENARYIVRCVNSHDDLLAALKAILADGVHCDVVPHLHEKARAAIKRAEGD